MSGTATDTGKGGGKSVLQIAREEREVLLGKTITVRCMDCPDFEAIGPAREARREWAQHRRDEHDDETAFASVERMDRELTLADLNRQPVIAGSPQLTRESIVSAVQRWAREHDGVPPRAVDWQGSREKRGPYPSYHAAIRVFPQGWRALLEASGFDPAANDGRRNGHGAQTSASEALRDLDEAAAPPTGEASPEGDEGGSEAEPSAEVEKPEEPTLVDLARRVEALNERISDLTLAIDDLVRQRDRAIAELGAAVGLIAVAEAA